MSPAPAAFDPGQALKEALSLQRQGRLRDAEKIYARVLKAAPDHFDALNLLGTVKAQLGRMGEAQRLLGAAVKANPRVPDAWVNLARVLHGLKRDADALDCLDKARALAPDNVDILNTHADALLSLGRPADALAEFSQVLARVPQHGPAHLSCGIAHAALGAAEAAVAAFDRALSLMPGHPAVHYNRGLALYELGRYAEAVAAHDAALAAWPDHAGAWLNRGRALAALNRLDDALASYGRAEALRRDDADTLFMQSLALLARGDYRAGFAKYEARWRRTGMPPAKSRGRALWRGEYSPVGKTLLLHAEQGLGDTIQFARYVPLLAQAGARIVLEVHPPLRKLMASLPGISAVMAPGETPPAFDAHCPLGSLPLALKTEFAAVPAPVPYLGADDASLAQWAARLGPRTRPRVALAWSGNPGHPNDRNRSIAFEALAPLLSRPVQFVSIQRDLRAADAAQLANEARVVPVGAALEDFTDTAAVIALADLVIAVDTAVAHLAGAMGRPVWVMLPFAPDWRWTLGGDTTPWYPTARLFRQASPGDWRGVIERVATELDSFCKRTDA